MPLCPVCDGITIDIRGKCVCPCCRLIVETCCEGGRCDYTKPQDQDTNVNTKTEPNHE